MNTAYIAAIMLALLLTTHAAMANDPACGDNADPIGGLASVDGAEARYRVRIAVPQNDDKLVPDVFVRYASRTGNGSAGMGWSLSAEQSTVHRCPAILDSDDYDDRVHYVDTDRLCLDGARLYLVEGNYGRKDSSYVTEMASGHLVLLMGDISRTDSHFVVQHGDQSASLYASVAAPDGAPAPLRWHRFAHIRKDGKYVSWHYEAHVADEVLLREIRYVGNADLERSTYLLGDQFVRFHYENRPDVGASFLGGGESRMSKRLTRIESGIQRQGAMPQLHASYHLSYRISQSSGRSLLERITGGRYGDDGRYRCHAPIRIEWLDRPIHFSEPSPMRIAWPEPTEAATGTLGQAAPAVPELVPIGDVDADGLVDYLVRDPEGNIRMIALDSQGRQRAAVALPPGFDLPRHDMGRSLAIDLQSMGAVNLIGRHAGRTVVTGWRGASLMPMMDTGQALDLERAIGVNIRSGAWHDVLVTADDGDDLAILVHRSLVHHPSEVRLGPPVRMLVIPDAAGRRLEHAGMLLGFGMTTLAVRDGKRITHFLDVDTHPGQMPGLQVRSADDYGLDPRAAMAGSLSADINNDGLWDVVFGVPGGNWHVQINSDGHFRPAQDTGLADLRSAVGRHSTLVADINADGMDDLVYPARPIHPFCLTVDSERRVCSGEFDESDAGLDFGIYAYHAIRFHLDARGQVRAALLDDIRLTSQANRTVASDALGDGLPTFSAPFDAGLRNAGFADSTGQLTPCPPTYGCGPRIARLQGDARDDLRDHALDMVSRVQNQRGRHARWHYYPLASGHPGLYDVPALDSPHRFRGSGRFYFRSSMFVPGEFHRTVGRKQRQSRYGYGGASYNTRGRGFEGFQWLVQEDAGSRQRTVYRFLQAFPYTGLTLSMWMEPARRSRRDYLLDTIPRNALVLLNQTWRCHGPDDHPATVRYGCTPADQYNFHTSTDDP